MGVLTDLIIGSEADLATVPDDEVPFNVLPGLDIKGFGPVELGILHANLGDTEFDPGLVDFPVVSGKNSEDGPWVFRFPGDLANRLADLSDEALARTADKLASDQQFHGWSLDDLVERLTDMRAFVKKAVAEAKPIHIWTSL